MSLYRQFQTEEDLEHDGVWLQFDDCKIRMARAGGRNKRYSKLLEKKLLRHKIQMASGTLKSGILDTITKEAFAEAVILDWQTLVDGSWKQGIESKDGKTLLPITSENILKVFGDLPDLYSILYDFAASAANYMLEERNEHSKNS